MLQAGEKKGALLKLQKAQLPRGGEEPFQRASMSRGMRVLQLFEDF
jgi:hypothetical protein